MSICHFKTLFFKFSSQITDALSSIHKTVFTVFTTSDSYRTLQHTLFNLTHHQTSATSNNDASHQPHPSLPGSSLRCRLSPKWRTSRFLYLRLRLRLHHLSWRASPIMSSCRDGTELRVSTDPYSQMKYVQLLNLFSNLSHAGIADVLMVSLEF